MKQKQATRQKPGVPVFAKFLTLFLFFALVPGLVSLQAQTSLNATGSNATGSGGSVSYSVGQLVYSACKKTHKHHYINMLMLITFLNLYMYLFAHFV